MNPSRAAYARSRASNAASGWSGHGGPIERYDFKFWYRPNAAGDVRERKILNKTVPSRRPHDPEAYLSDFELDHVF